MVCTAFSISATKQILPLGGIRTHLCFTLPQQYGADVRV